MEKESSEPAIPCFCGCRLRASEIRRPDPQAHPLAQKSGFAGSTQLKKASGCNGNNIYVHNLPTVSAKYKKKRIVDTLHPVFHPPPIPANPGLPGWDPLQKPRFPGLIRAVVEPVSWRGGRCDVLGRIQPKKWDFSLFFPEISPAFMYLEILYYAAIYNYIHAYLIYDGGNPECRGGFYMGCPPAVGGK